ncbi:MAG: signal peptidase I [Eubacterium sp.]|nr:signal peptidase I [Eubacterium sp.]
MTKQKKKKRKGRMAAAICHLFGCGILILVIAALAPITVPKFMGYEIFNVISGSMEPEIPIGSVAYVEQTEPALIEDDEVIAFMSGGTVIMHRVVSNHQVEGYLTTRGDANEVDDLGEVTYDMVIGRVVRHLPILGQVMMVCSSNIGKALLLCLAACGALLNILAGRFRVPKEEV